ncbi:MAG: hypothetical protein JW828_14210 [Sedimentisphaerales bacterium]|nr:hypothetical protein [Sedimentisphaerales bacterium]
MRRCKTTVLAEDPFAAFSCPNNFQCCDRTDFSRLARFGESRCVQCLSDEGPTCPHAVDFSDIHLCNCPVRTHLLDRLAERQGDLSPVLS